MCVVCRNRYPKGELIRIVKSAEFAEIDISAKAQARGAYVCHSDKCINKLIEKNIIKNHLQQSLSENAKDELRKFSNGK